MHTPTIDLACVLALQEQPAVAIDEQYRIVAANPAYCAAYGVQADAVIGRRCHEVSHHSAVPCHHNGECCPHREVFRSGAPCEVLHTHYDADDRPDQVRIRAAALTSTDGRRLLLERIDRLSPAAADDAPQTPFPVGRSAAFVHGLERLRLAARVDLALLITGESGVGKELAAQHVHQLSMRRAHRFVALNCAAIPEALCEDELFGHEPGAYTGSIGRRVGLFELADQGTLFLDEIGEMPLVAQAKLLRVLDSGELRRLGGHQLIRVDTRVIAATHRDLRQMVRAGAFREDLFYRLSGVEARIPPLRERREDLPALAAMLLRQLCRRATDECRLSRDALARLLAYSFPGNVRELKSLLTRALALSGGGVILPEHIQFDEPVHAVQTPTRAVLPAYATSSLQPSVEVGVRVATGSESVSRSSSIAALERHHIEQQLQVYAGNRRHAAQSLGISERTLYRKLLRYGLTPQAPDDSQRA